MQAFVMGDSEPQPSTDDPIIASNGAPPPDEEEPECAAVTEWRAQWARRLEEKVIEERKVKAERAEQASHTLGTMHSRWDGAKRSAADANMKADKEFIRQRDGVISRISRKGEKPNWDIVPQLVDMTGKYKEGARDTSRMRQVLMRMKTN